MQQKLIIYTRYPQPGKTKTRMIPKLGAEGAALLQRQMTEHTLSQARQLLSDRSIFSLSSFSLEIHFAGGNQSLMQEWLGEQLIYRAQRKGNLGEKMYNSFIDSFEQFEQNRGKVVIIGTDCPLITPSILFSAFKLLQNNDLVLGPATDGGYYLIGLICPIPELFNNISWGSDQVFPQTQAIAQTMGLRVGLLPTLHDIDIPEDLPHWELCRMTTM